MTKREKEKEVFVSLVNKQLEPFGVTYEDVKENPNWYMEYRTTADAEKEFMQWGTDLIRKKLRMTNERAVMEMNWFILQWGLTTTVSDQIKQKTTTATATKKKAQ